jgi:hypothetical protein
VIILISLYPNYTEHFKYIFNVHEFALYYLPGGIYCLNFNITLASGIEHEVFADLTTRVPMPVAELIRTLATEMQHGSLHTDTCEIWHTASSGEWLQRL